MAVALLPRTHSRESADPPASYHRVMAASDQHRKPPGWLRYAPAGVSGLTSALVLVQVVWLTTPPDRWDPDYGRGGLALAAAAVLLPFHIHHVYSAATGSRARGGGWTLAVLAVIVIGALPAVGPYWMPVFFVLPVSALIVVRPPWSWAIVVAAVAMPAPLGLLMGVEPLFAFWYVIAVVFRAMAVFALVWLVGVTRRLQQARVALAERAVAVERMRIDDEIRQRMGATLESIADRGRQALLEPDPTGLDAPLRDLVGEARATAEEVRRLASSYRGTSARAALDTAVALLAAAGIHARVEVAGGGLPPTMDAEALGSLRSATARLLTGPPVERCVVTVTVTGGRLGIEVRPGDTPAAVRTGAAP